MNTLVPSEAIRSMLANLPMRRVERICALCEAVEAFLAAPPAQRALAAKRIAQEYAGRIPGGLSLKSLYRKAAAYRAAEDRGQGGWSAFLPPAAAVGRAAAGIGANAAFLEHWCDLLTQNQRVARTALSRLVAELRAELEIPGYGTWRDIWSAEHPGRDLPKECPYKIGALLPIGWSLPNLMRHKPSKWALGGTDLEMSAGQSIRYFKEPLAQAVREGKVSEARLDDMARRVLYVQAKLGKLDGRTRAKGARNTPEHQALAREIAADGMVLLKNDNGLLPLAPKALRRVLVVGRNATERHCRGGSSAEGKPPHEITPLEGLRSALPGVEIVQVPFPAPKTSFGSLPDAILLTENPSKTNDTGMRDAGWVWERFANGALSGTPAATGFIRAPGLAKEEKGTSFSMRWRTRFRAPESGRYTFGFTCDDGARLVLDGKPLIDDWQDGAARTRSAEIDLAAGSEHDLVLEYRQAGGDAVLAFGWRLPSERGVDVSALLAEAKKADTVILMPGTRHGWGRALECEGGDRPDLLLAPGENESIAALLREKARTVVVLHAGSPLELPWADQAKTLLLMSYSGQEAGHALADVLLGKREPSGRLTCTWPRRLADSPAHALDCYKADASKHKEGLLLGYRWFDAKSIAPLFPFGYGLGYATFAFGTPEAKVRGDGVTLRVPVTNTSARAGAAVVQVYVEPRPKALCRARRVSSRPLPSFASPPAKPGPQSSRWSLAPSPIGTLPCPAGAMRPAPSPSPSAPPAVTLRTASRWSSRHGRSRAPSPRTRWWAIRPRRSPSERTA